MNIYRSIVLFILLSLPATGATATYEFILPLTVSNTSTFLSGMTIDTTDGTPLNVATNRLVISGGLTGLGATPSGARLDVKYTGSGNKVQVWRNSGGTEVASMSDAGVLSPGQTCIPTYPPGMVMFFDGACPSGWTELTNVRGRYIVGPPFGGTLGGTQGTALANTESRPVGGHGHNITDPGHPHTGVQYDNTSEFGATPTSPFTAVDHAGVYTDASAANITVEDPACPSGNCTTGGTNAPYIQFRVCQKD